MAMRTGIPANGGTCLSLDLMALLTEHAAWRALKAMRVGIPLDVDTHPVSKFNEHVPWCRHPTVCRFLRGISTTSHNISII